MTVHTIDMTPTWDTATRIYLEVLRVNDWDSDAGKRAREGIFEMAQHLDGIIETQKKIKANKGGE